MTIRLMSNGALSRVSDEKFQMSSQGPIMTPTPIGDRLACQPEPGGVICPHATPPKPFEFSICY